MEKSLDIRKNSLTLLRVSIEQHKGTEFLSLRNWYRDPLNDTWHPTRKGVTLKVPQIRELVSALNSISEDKENKGAAND